MRAPLSQAPVDQVARYTSNHDEQVIDQVADLIDFQKNNKSRSADYAGPRFDGAEDTTFTSSNLETTFETTHALKRANVEIYTG